MTTTKTAPTTEASPATKALAAATKTTAAAGGAIGPARDALQASREALAAANAEALQAIVVKNPDPQAARDRIEKSRAAVKAAEDAVNWRILELHAFEAQHEEAHNAEQSARRAVIVDEYLTEHARSNDPGNRENVLVGQLQSVLTELTVALSDRDSLHNRLAAEWSAIPSDERPPLKSGPLTPRSNSLRGEFIDALHPEVAEALKAATGAAAGQLQHR